MNRDTETALYKVQDLVQKYNLDIRSAISKIKGSCDLDGELVYDTSTGETLNDIDTATDEQIKSLLEGWKCWLEAKIDIF